MAICDNCELAGKTRNLQVGDETQMLCEPCVSLFNDDHSIRVSPLEHGDLELVLAWRSNPKVYRHFRQQEGPLVWDEHVAWFEYRDSDRYDFIIHYEGRRVGVVNLSTDNEVGVYLGDFSAHGQGVATIALSWLCERFKEREPLIAEIHEENDASKQLFSRCGFEQKGCDGDWLRYVYEP